MRSSFAVAALLCIVALLFVSFVVAHDEGCVEQGSENTFDSRVTNNEAADAQHEEQQQQALPTGERAEVRNNLPPDASGATWFQGELPPIPEWAQVWQLSCLVFALPLSLSLSLSLALALTLSLSI
jgi:hypothetical protein